MSKLDIYQSRQEFIQEVIDRYLYLPADESALFRSRIEALFEEFPIKKTVQNSVHIIHREKPSYEKSKDTPVSPRDFITYERLRQLSVLRSTLRTEESENH